MIWILGVLQHLVILTNTHRASLLLPREQQLFFSLTFVLRTVLEVALTRYLNKGFHLWLLNVLSRTKNVQKPPTYEPERTKSDVFFFCSMHLKKASAPLPADLSPPHREDSLSCTLPEWAGMSNSVLKKKCLAYYCPSTLIAL